MPQNADAVQPPSTNCLAPALPPPIPVNPEIFPEQNTGPIEIKPLPRTKGAVHVHETRSRIPVTGHGHGTR